jgi:hypothetical protein
MASTAGLVDGCSCVLVSRVTGGALEVPADVAKGCEVAFVTTAFADNAVVAQTFVARIGADAVSFSLSPKGDEALFLDYTIADSPPILWSADDTGAANPSQFFRVHRLDGGEWIAIESVGNEGQFLAVDGAGVIALAPAAIEALSSEQKFHLRLVIAESSATSAKEPEKVADAAPAAKPDEPQNNSVAETQDNTNTAAPAKEEAPAEPTAAEPTPSKAAKPAAETKSSAPPSESSEVRGDRTSGMTREEFMRSMGLTSDDVADPSAKSDTVPTKLNPKSVDDDIDEDLVKKLDLADPSLFQQAPASSAYRAQELEKFRTKSSGSSPQKSTNRSLAAERSDTEAVTDHSSAENYKSRLLDDFRNRKAAGVAKAPPVSPRRDPPAAAATPAEKQ